MKKRSLRNRKLLSSRTSKILFSFIVFMLGAVIVFAGRDIYDVWKGKGFYLSPKETAQINIQILEGQENYEIEYKVPDYLPEQLKHPQNIFSGRDIKIVKRGGKPLLA